MKRIFIGNKLWEGQRVIGIKEDGSEMYKGIVYSVDMNSATIKRDDGMSGGGKPIDKYGYGWAVNFDTRTKKWKSSNLNQGDLIIVK